MLASRTSSLEISTATSSLGSRDVVDPSREKVSGTIHFDLRNSTSLWSGLYRQSSSFTEKRRRGYQFPATNQGGGRVLTESAAGITVACLPPTSSGRSPRAVSLSGLEQCLNLLPGVLGLPVERGGAARTIREGKSGWNPYRLRGICQQ
jgi:hypothetical protein